MAGSMPMCRSSDSKLSLPRAMFSSRFSFLNHCLILMRAWFERQMFSQSRLGPLRALRGQDFDDVAVVQLRVVARDAVIHLRADHRVADGRVDGIGEVDRRGAGGQADDLALRREDEDLVVEHVDLEGVDIVVGLGVLLVLEQAAHPLKFLFRSLHPRAACISSAPQHRIPRSGASPTSGSGPRTGCPACR